MLHNQANPKNLKVEQNWEGWNDLNYIFFLRNYLSPVDSGRETFKHQLSSGEVVSPNQVCK